jgi:lipoprotein-anchoring transpeptidase ErfK/SrfK
MRLVLAIMATLMMCGLAQAQGAKVSSPVELARQADQLKPGQWVWAPDIAPKGPILVYVDLSTQVATVYRNGVRIGVSTVSTGKPGHETPTGVFTILQKDANHHSSKYNNAPMPFQQRLTWDGVALHAGGLPGYPESHGCVHLPYAFAKSLFVTTDLGATVIVAGNASHPVSTGGGQVIAPSAAATGATGDYWTPEKSPWGPVTIILSRSDQQAVVLRNGIEIGRSHVALPADDEATHVLTLSSDASGKTQWIYAEVAGHTDEAGRVVDEAARNRVQIPPDFYAKVSAILQPGATLLVTGAPLDTGSTGKKLTVLTGDSAAGS